MMLIWKQLGGNVLGMLVLAITVLAILPKPSAANDHSAWRDHYSNNINGMNSMIGQIDNFNKCMQTRKGPCAMQDCTYWWCLEMNNKYDMGANCVSQKQMVDQCYSNHRQNQELNRTIQQRNQALVQCADLRERFTKAIRSGDTFFSKQHLDNARNCGWYERGKGEYYSLLNSKTNKSNYSSTAAQRPSACNGACCRGHHLVCSESYGKQYSYPNTALDRNLDGRCDICGRTYVTKDRKLAPGLRGARRGDVSCRVQ